MKKDNFDIAWKTLRNNPKFALSGEWSEQDLENLWEERKKWFTFGWNNKAVFKDNGIRLVEKKIQLVKS